MTFWFFFIFENRSKQIVKSINILLKKNQPEIWFKKEKFYQIKCTRTFKNILYGKVKKKVVVCEKQLRTREVSSSFMKTRTFNQSDILYRLLSFISEINNHCIKHTGPRSRLNKIPQFYRNCQALKET